MGLGRNDMGDELYRTVKIKLNREDGTDSQGRPVGTNPAEETEFELVSTMMLKQILESDDDQKKDQIRGLANEEDGVLACSTDSAEFKILLDDELESALKSSPNPELAEAVGGSAVDVTEKSDEEEDIALVSTQLLRTMLHDDDKTDVEPNKTDVEPNKADVEPNKADGEPKEEFKIGGFNPYDTS
jgi:hypothetical protein